MRIWAAAAIAVATMVVSASPTPAAPKPVRAGTITGWGYTWPAMFSGAAWECQSNGWTVGANPECVAWLKSGCNPALAGRNPAVTASIVDVTQLADGTSSRTFRWRAPQGFDFGGVVVQLWRRDCKEITASKWVSAEWHYLAPRTNRKSTTFVIPPTAAWMTVTTNDTANIEWTLS